MFRKPMIATAIGAALACAALTAALAQAAPSTPNPATPKFTNPTSINNPYLPITAFRRCQLAGPDQGQRLHITRTLLTGTQTFTYAGQTFQAVRVLDKVVDLKKGERIERTVDYFAQSDAGDVYYLGEDVNEYRHGKVINHEGQWRLGVNTQVPGILMTAHPAVGQMFDSENVPNVVHETSSVAGIGGTRKIKKRTYSNVLTIREDATSPGIPPEVEYKNYAPGVGVITEANGGVRLLRCS